MAADARRAIGHYPAVVEGVHPLGEMLLAEVALAERAFEAGVRAALLHAAKPGPVTLHHARTVDQMRIKVVLFNAALLARADRFVTFGEVGMGHAEVSPAILARVLGSV